MKFKPLDHRIYESEDGLYRIWEDSKLPSGRIMWGAARVIRETGKLPRLRVLGRQLNGPADATEVCDKDATALLLFGAKPETKGTA